MREVAFNGPLGAVTNAQLGELGPPGQLAGDGVDRPSLHNNPTGHEAAGLVTASPQQLLYTRHQLVLSSVIRTVPSFACRRSLASILHSWSR